MIYDRVDLDVVVSGKDHRDDDDDDEMTLDGERDKPSRRNHECRSRIVVAYTHNPLCVSVCNDRSPDSFIHSFFLSFAH